MSEQCRMTIAEIALMRQVIAWRKANGIDFAGGGRLSQGSRAADWVDVGGITGPSRRAVSVSFGDVDPLGICAGRRKSYRWIEVDSVTEGVDILVAKGYLPKRFSSAYAAGYVAGGTNFWAEMHGVPDPQAHASRIPAARA